MTIELLSYGTQLVALCVYVCQKNDHASSKTRTLDSCFVLVGPDQQGAELCSSLRNTAHNKWSVPHLWAKLTNDHPTGCAATMATRHHKQGPSSCLYVSARQPIASSQHSDCKRGRLRNFPGIPCVQKGMVKKRLWL